LWHFLTEEEQLVVSPEKKVEAFRKTPFNGGDLNFKAFHPNFDFPIKTITPNLDCNEFN